MMTTLLAKAFDEATRLPDMEQNALAKWLLDELEDDRKWSKTFAESEDVLDQLADESLQAKKQGKTAPLDHFPLCPKSSCFSRTPLRRDNHRGIDL
jgi:hypothetical protein